MHIRRLEEGDVGELSALWAECFGPDWPMEPGEILERSRALIGDGECWLAEEAGLLVGLAIGSVQVEGQNGSILAVGVRPQLRRRGVARMLEQRAHASLAKRGVRRIQLGAGGQDYFWPGVPRGLKGGWEFFAAQEWPLCDAGFDLYAALQDYRTPAPIYERVSGLGLQIAAALPGEKEAVLALVAQSSRPDWSAYFAAAFREGRADEVILARADGTAVAACLLESNRRWVKRFAGPSAAIACVVTAADSRRRGIGLALVARASEMAQERGFRSAFIGWTWLAEWYGRLGYRRWQEYVVSWKDL